MAARRPPQRPSSTAPTTGGRWWSTNLQAVEPKLGAFDGEKKIRKNEKKIRKN